MIQFSLAKTRRRALYLTAAFAAAGFLTMGLNNTAQAVPAAPGTDTIVWYNDTVNVWDPASLGAATPAVNVFVQTGTTTTWSTLNLAGKRFILDVDATGGVGPVSLYLGDQTSSGLSITSVTFADSNFAGGNAGLDNSAVFNWLAGSLTITGDVTATSAKNVGAVNVFGVHSIGNITTTGADVTVDVGGNILANNNNTLQVIVGGYSDAEVDNNSGIALVSDVRGATTLTVAGNLILQNVGNDSFAAVDSTLNNSTLTVAGNIGERISGAAGLLYNNVVANTTPLVSVVGAGTTWAAGVGPAAYPAAGPYTNWAARDFDATTSAANIYTSSISITTTGINNNDTIAALASTPGFNSYNITANTWNADAVNGNVTYEATGDLLAASVNVSVAPNITDYDAVTSSPATGWDNFSGDAAVYGVWDNVANTVTFPQTGAANPNFTPHAGGGDITFTAGDDISLNIDSFTSVSGFAVDVYLPDTSLYDTFAFETRGQGLTNFFDASTTGLFGANYDGAVSFSAGHDLEVNYTAPGFGGQIWIDNGASQGGAFTNPSTVITTLDGNNYDAWVFITHNYVDPVTGNSTGFITGNDLSHSGLSYTAGNNMTVNYNGNFIFVNSVGSNGLSYLAGNDISINLAGNTLSFYDSTSNVTGGTTADSGLNINAYHNIAINGSLQYTAGTLGYGVTVAGADGVPAGTGADVAVDMLTAHNRTLGAAGMDITSETGSIGIANNLFIDAGTGAVTITANSLGARDDDRGGSSPGDITIGEVGGNLVATVYDRGATPTGNITITGKNPSGTAIMEVGFGAFGNIFQVAAGAATDPTTASITVDVDNFVSRDWTVLRLDGYTSGDITITTSTNTRQTPLDELFDAAGFDAPAGVFTALENQWRYGFEPIKGSVFASTGRLYLDVEEGVAGGITAATGTITVSTDNLIAADGLWLDGDADQIILDVTDGGWWGLGGSIASLNSNLPDRLREFTPTRVTLVNDATTVTHWADDTWLDTFITNDAIPSLNDFDDVRVTTNLIYIPDTSRIDLFSSVYPDAALTDGVRYERRIADGSLYIGGDTVADFYGTGAGVNTHAANETTGFWTQTLVVGGGEYIYDGRGVGNHNFDQTRLTIEDRLVMTTRGQIDIYDGGSIRFDYDEIERLTNATLIAGAGGTAQPANKAGHFNASHINTSGINYYFVDATTLMTEADEITDGVRTTSDVWGFKVTEDGQIVDASLPGPDAIDGFHNVVISMTDPHETYNGDPSDNLTTIGFDPTQFSTNLDRSPFFNITHGWIGENQYAYGIHGITWQLDGNGNPHTLISRAPTHALGQMAGVLLDDQWNWNGDGDADNPNYNHITNMLYLSQTLGQYQRDITTISAGSNLNAAYMVSHHVHKMAIDRAGEYNRLVASVAAPSGDAPATGYENASVMNGLWINPYYQYKEMDDDFGNGVLGYDISSWGFVGGYDRQIVDQFRVGFYFGATQPKLEDNNGGNIDGKDFQIGIYGSWSDPNLFEVNVGLGFGWQDYEADRNITISRPGNQPYLDRLSADYDGDSIDFNIEVAKPIFLENNIWLRPAIGYNFQSTSLDGFTERSPRHWGNGGDSLAQRVGDADLDQHFFRLGLSGGWDSEMFGISGKLFWVGRTGDDRPEASSYFLAPYSAGYGVSGSNHFRVEGAEADDSSINLGLNVNAYLNEEKTATFNVGFDTLLGSDEQTYMVNVGLSYQF